MMKFCVSLLCAVSLALFLPVWAFGQGEVVTVKGPNAPLSAVYHKPAGVADGQKCPMAILCHGFGSNKEDALLRQVAVELERRGVATLLFDFAGSGASVAKRFGFEDMTVATEEEDLEAVVDYARDLPFVSSVALVGHSMGGAVSILAAADEGRRVVKALAVMAPAVSMREDAVRGSIFGVTFNPAEPPRRLSLWGGDVTISRDFIRKAQETNFLKEAASYKGPAFIVFGTADAVVPHTYGQYLKQVMPSADLKEYEGLDHCLSQPGNPKAQAEVAEAVAQFVAGELK